MTSVTDASLRAQARPLNAGATSLIVLLCLFWGLNQVAVKFSAPDIPPFVQATVRSFAGMLIVYGFARLRGVSLSLNDGTLLPGIAAGVLFGLEFVLIYRGLTFTSASRASLFIYTAPVFVALGSRWLLPGDRLRATHWAGLVLCFAGLAAAIGVPQPAVDARMLIGDVMMIGAGAAWAATTLVVKATKLVSAAPEKTLLYQLAVSVPILAISIAAFGEHITHAPGPVALSWLVYQVLVVGLTFPVWFSFIQRYSATRVSAFTFLAPLFGVAAGCLLLNEPFSIAFGVAVALVIGGLVLVNRRA
jgi:drug/metabolite transporter (DMT)-like permease